MFNRVFLVVYVLLFSVLLSTAAPVPVDGALTKKGLKQLKLKRGDPAPVKREGVELYACPLHLLPCCFSNLFYSVGSTRGRMPLPRSLPNGWTKSHYSLSDHKTNPKIDRAFKA